MKTTKHAYIETFGCQMNERDSEIMTQLLSEAGYSCSNDIKLADLVVINTCSIREKAEQKAFSLLGRLRKQKQANPSLIIAVTGCVAQQEGQNLAARIPYIDLVVGTQNIYALPELVNKIQKGNPRQIAINLSEKYRIPPYLPSPVPAGEQEKAQQKEFKKFVTIMQGCNNFCTYCVVPFTRGREVSRPGDDILEEIRLYSARGIREVTLLGQNVNSYGKDYGDDSIMTFPLLLAEIAKIEGIDRIRFTTSHPKDLSQELMRSFAEIPKLCPHFHLPVQSGSNSILKRMNRKYTREVYLDKIHTLRQYRPDIAISTDIIVGFPGESDADFAATMELLEMVRFHSAFSFKYSDRPNARSAAFDEKISEELKTERLKKLQARQDEISLERNREYIGKKLLVMVEGKSKSHNSHQLCGRSDTNHIVNFQGKELLPGQLVEVTIHEGLLHSLRGQHQQTLKEAS